jgi:hypothetical protein
METFLFFSRRWSNLNEELTQMLHKCHRPGLLSKPYNAVVQIDLWETNQVTVGELFAESGALVANSLNGAAVRLFKHPCPVPYCLLMQRVSYELRIEN